MLRRPLLFGACAAALNLAGCSRDEAKTPTGAPAAAGTPAADAARKAYETAAGGTGFSVGQAMAARTVRVFFDPQCPHCAQLWTAARPLHDRVRWVWMPVAFIAPASAPQGALLLAAADPLATMDRHEQLLAAGQGGLPLPATADAGRLAAVKANTDLWKRSGADSVPHMVYRITVDGPHGVQPGGLPTAQLVQMLGL